MSKEQSKSTSLSSSKPMSALVTLRENSVKIDLGEYLLEISRKEGQQIVIRQPQVSLTKLPIANLINPTSSAKSAAAQPVIYVVDSEEEDDEIPVLKRRGRANKLRAKSDTNSSTKSQITIEKRTRPQVERKRYVELSSSDSSSDDESLSAQSAWSAESDIDIDQEIQSKRVMAPERGVGMRLKPRSCSLLLNRPKQQQQQQQPQKQASNGPATSRKLRDRPKREKSKYQVKYGRFMND